MIGDPSIGQPEFKPGLNSYEFKWRELGVTIAIDRLDDEGQGEIAVKHCSNEEERLLCWSKTNLLSVQSSTQLAKRLKENLDIDWVTILTYVSSKTFQHHRQGEPARQIGREPRNLEVEYQLCPLLEKGQPTTLYAPGGSGKSYLADYIAVLVQHNYLGLVNGDTGGLVPKAGNVLYLDWESSFDDHARRIWLIKKGLGVDTEETFLYRPCSQPLVNDIYAVQKEVFDSKIDLVILDSQMAASGYGPDPAQVASQYYNALRSLKCTSLTIDHVSKSEWRGDSGGESVGMYGSVAKWNRARCVWEIKKAQNPGDDFFDLSLVHKKHNEGKLINPIGIRINFHQENGRTEKVTFESLDLASLPILSKSLPVWKRIQSELKRGTMTITALASTLEVSENSIKSELYRKKGKVFAQINGDDWGLLSYA